jgi:hypothetical protein
MSVSMSEARALCTKDELALVQEGAAAVLKDLSVRRLRDNIQRARRLRDKYRDEAARQRREARGKQRPRGRRPAGGNARTVQKQRLFAEVLEKFQSQLERLEAGRPQAAMGGPRRSRRSKPRQKGRATAAAKEQGRPAPPSATPSAIKKGGAAPKVKKDEGKLAALLMGSALEQILRQQTSLRHRSDATHGRRIDKNLKRMNTRKIHAHVSASGRRAQARRDSK